MNDYLETESTQRNCIQLNPYWNNHIQKNKSNEASNWKRRKIQQLILQLQESKETKKNENKWRKSYYSEKMKLERSSGSWKEKKPRQC